MTSADLFDGVRDFIRKELAQRPVPSIAVAVVRDGGIVWEEGFGWADLENQVPAGPRTAYSLASISKPITATGLMAMAQSGRVDLDRPVNDYLGSGKLTARVGDERKATVCTVADHSSG
ncbi:MAG TPA: serine hydrolase domain-containing protein, partial [Caulobacteraceae bacterium]